jgi:hypothetical protein
MRCDWCPAQFDKGDYLAMATHVVQSHPKEAILQLKQIYEMGSAINKMFGYDTI